MYVLDYLRNQRVGFEAFLHRPASSATRLAHNAHVPGRSVAKTVVVRAGEAFALAVLPATARVNLELLALALRTERSSVRLATAEEVEQVFHDCEPGAIPPFGRLYGLRVVIDPSLADAESVVFRSNARHQGIRMAFGAFEGLEEPIRAWFAEPICPARSPSMGPRHRHAG